MIRSILLPLPEAPLAAATRDYAFWLAGKEGSCINALAVIDVKAFEIPVLGTPDGFMPSVVTPPLAESQSLMTELAAVAKDRLGEFAEECNRANIRYATETRTGLPGEVIARQAIAHDIVVMSRSGYTRAAVPENRVDPLVSDVIRGSIRPVLVTGMSFPGNGEVRKIVVAFDGSSHAARVLLVAAELGARPGVECTILTVSPSQETAHETIEPAEAFLYHHGLVPRKQVVPGSRASEVICEVATGLRADMLIMGAYGHAPVREMLFGSTTERVLSHCGTTVVLQS
jgi:nucleotide-binding universal stress UspA family protein